MGVQAAAVMMLVVVGAGAQLSDDLSQEQLKRLTAFRRSIAVWSVVLCLVRKFHVGPSRSSFQVDGRLCAAAFVQDWIVLAGSL